MSKVQLGAVKPKRLLWDKRQPISQKRPLLPKQVCAIRARLELAGNLRDLNLFNLAINTKLRDCDIFRFEVAEFVTLRGVRDRFPVIQNMTEIPVRVEVYDGTLSSNRK